MGGHIMKKWRYLFSFAGLMALCVVVGLGFFIYCNSDTQEESKDRNIPVTITVVDGAIEVNPDPVEANHNDWIEWSCADTDVVSFAIYFGYNSPMGDQNGMQFEAQLLPEGKSRSVRKRVWHNPHYAGGRHNKYYVAVYYKPENEDGKVLIADPDIIIPPRGR